MGWCVVRAHSWIQTASGKATTYSQEFLRPWNNIVRSRTRAQNSEVSKQSVELFQESVHSFPFSHKFKYVINKSFVCKRVYWNKKYLNGMLFVCTLCKMSCFLFIFFVANTLNRKVAVSVSPLLLFQQHAPTLTCCTLPESAAKPSQPVTHKWDVLLCQIEAVPHEPRAVCEQSISHCAA